VAGGRGGARRGKINRKEAGVDKVIHSEDRLSIKRKPNWRRKELSDTEKEKQRIKITLTWK